MTNVIKKLLAERQARRLHIEQMRVTQEAMRQRAKDHEHDTLSWKTAHAAVINLDEKIAIAERELNTLEKKWSW